MYNMIEKLTCMLQLLYSAKIYCGKKYTQTKREVICLGVECQVLSRQENTYISLKAFTK